MPDADKYLDPADRDKLLVRLAILNAHCLFDCPLEGRFPDCQFFVSLRDMYLREYSLETDIPSRLKAMLRRVREKSKKKMETSTPTTRSPHQQAPEDLWGQIQEVFDLMVYTKKMQRSRKDLDTASKVCNSGIEPASLLRPLAKSMADLEVMRDSLLAIARDISSGHSAWLRSFNRDVSIRMQDRCSETMSCTLTSDDGDDEYDDEKDGDLSDDDRTTNGYSEDRDATLSPATQATPLSSSFSVLDRNFSSPFSSSATDPSSDDEANCENLIMKSRSPTPSPMECPPPVQGLPRSGPAQVEPLPQNATYSSARFVPVDSNTASIRSDIRFSSQHPPSSPLESTNGNLASVEDPGSGCNAMAYVDLMEHDDASGHPVDEVLQVAVPARNQETPRVPPKRVTPARNGVFEVAFPGGVRTLAAPRNGYCGFYAIILSYEAQYPHHPPPTVETLMDVLQSRAMEGIMETLEASRFTGDEQPEIDFTYNNTDWFLHDHLAAIFCLWGHQVGLKVALGIRTNNIPYLHDNDDTDEDTIVVWIQHNGLDHYDGLAPERPGQGEDDEPAGVPALDSTRSPIPRRSSAFSGHHVCPNDSYEMVEREEASPHTKDCLAPVDLMPVDFDEFSFDAFCGDDGSSKRLGVSDLQPQPENYCNMSDDSDTMRQSSRSTSSQLGHLDSFQQYANLDGTSERTYAFEREAPSSELHSTTHTGRHSTAPSACSPPLAEPAVLSGWGLYSSYSTSSCWSAKPLYPLKPQGGLSPTRTRGPVGLKESVGETTSARTEATIAMGAVGREHEASPEMDRQRQGIREKRRRYRKRRKQKQHAKGGMAELEGREKMMSPDLMRSGALQKGPVGGEVTPPTERQLPTPQPSQPQKQTLLKRKHGAAESHHSQGPGTLGSSRLPHRPKDPETTSHPPQKRSRHDLAHGRSPHPGY